MLYTSAPSWRKSPIPGLTEQIANFVASFKLKQQETVTSSRDEGTSRWGLGFTCFKSHINKIQN